MALERTLSIVKPDGVSRNLIGQVYQPPGEGESVHHCRPHAAPVAA